uniref:Geranylgeranyl transferase type I subunit beta n=1 Tax=Panagrolaimus superbus TaxID=310955 RepID=A0A914YTL7_9BILA
MSAAGASAEIKGFFFKRHAKLLKAMLKCTPEPYASLETNRLTLLFFLLSGLDLINELNNVVDEKMKNELIENIYKMQLINGSIPERYGFRGSLSASAPKNSSEACPFDSSHIAQTYSGLCCLLILGDDLSRVNKKAILEAVGLCQRPDGSFTGFGASTESDMRFVFCAAAVCYILDDFTYIDIERMIEFISKSRTYEGGFGQAPRCEAHGGSTYCAIASLSLVHHLHDNTVLNKKQMNKLITWGTQQQDIGFHGRTNKCDDTCYAFWIGATLAMLNSEDLVDFLKLREFLVECEDTRLGGFCKYTDSESSGMFSKQ